MTMLDPLFMDIQEVYSGDEFGLPYRDLIGEGVVAPADGGFEVTAGSGNSVDVAAGAAWVEGDTNTDRQPTYRCLNDATLNVGISPDPSNPRKVLVVIQITDEAFDGTGREADVQAIHGTPAASPSDPALPDSALLLATLDVPAGAADSSSYTITDERGPARIGEGNLPIVTEATVVATTVAALGTGTSGKQGIIRADSTPDGDTDAEFVGLVYDTTLSQWVSEAIRTRLSPDVAFGGGSAYSDQLAALLHLPNYKVLYDAGLRLQVNFSAQKTGASSNDAVAEARLAEWSDADTSLTTLGSDVSLGLTFSVDNSYRTSGWKTVDPAAPSENNVRLEIRVSSAANTGNHTFKDMTLALRWVSA